MPLAPWMPLVTASDAVHTTLEDGDPAERQEQLVGAAQDQLGRDLEIVEVDVRLKEAG